MYARAWLLVLGGCASVPPPPAPPPAPEPPAAPDRVLETAARRLPAGADACSVAQPALLPAGTRARFQRAMQSDPLAFSDALPVRAFASATRSRPGGTAEYVAFLWVDADAPGFEAALEAATGWDIRWNAPPGPCTPDACGTSARRVEPGVVQLERGPWSGGEGVSEVRCLELARSHPDALEVSARDTGPRRRRFGRDVEVFEPSDRMPLRTSAVVRAGPDRLTILRTEVMASEQAAERVVQGGARSGGAPMGMEPIATDVRRRRENALVLTTLEVLFDDLALREADEARLAAATRFTAANAALMDPDEVPVEDMDVLRRQLERYRTAIATSTHPDPRDLRDALHRLLTRAVEAHPDDAALRGALDELSAPEAPTPAR